MVDAALSRTLLLAALSALSACRADGASTTTQDAGRDVRVVDVPPANDLGRDVVASDIEPSRDLGLDAPPVDPPSGMDAASASDATVDAPGVDAPIDVPAPDDVPLGPVPADTVMFTGSFADAPGERTARLTVGGQLREMLVYVPRTRAKRAPLLVLLHGTNDTPEAIFSEGAARDVADANGVLLVGPSAVFQSTSDWDHPDQEGRWWRTAPSVDPNTNPDLLLLRAIFAAAIRDWNVDPDRVYLIGHSNGAFFAQLAAMTLNDRVAAWASSSGGLCNCRERPDCAFAGEGSTCAALALRPGWCACSGPDLPGPVNARGRRPPAWITHGSNDDIVSVYYSCALASRLASAGYDTRVEIRDGEQHVMPDRFAETVWPWLSARRRE
ncbi:MAG: PHB depolymerase family esterase [Polyangiales bacterium]